jgi:hypothetical protein
MDPLVPSSWYEASTKFMQEKVSQFLSLCLPVGNFNYFKGAKNVLYPYNGSFARATMHLFQEIGLQESKFKILPSMSIP